MGILTTDDKFLYVKINNKAVKNNYNVELDITEDYDINLLKPNIIINEDISQEVFSAEPMIIIPLSQEVVEDNNDQKESTNRIVTKISTPKKSKKLIYTKYNSVLNKNITKNGYQLTISEFPNVEIYLTNENYNQDSSENSTEFNTKNKEWNIEIVHPVKGLMNFPIRFVTKMNDVIESFVNDINDKYSKTEQGIKVLKEIGIEFSKNITFDQIKEKWLEANFTEQDWNDMTQEERTQIIENCL